MSKSDTENNFPINFHPMPKRFMVWSDQLSDFARTENSEAYIFDNITLIVEWLSVNHLAYNKIKLIQSTNLFDKDGNEIFEGSIVEAFTNINKISDPKLSDNKPRYGLKIVELYDGAFRLSSKEYPHGCGILNNYVGAMAKDLKVVGHILSNPELLEEKDV